MNDGRFEGKKSNIVIVAAACMVQGHMFIGVRHFCPLMAHQIDLAGLEESVSCDGTFEGFVDNRGRFYNREEAYKLVQENGQPFSQERNVSYKELYSEGLW